jgi:hypothetical protein
VLHSVRSLLLEAFFDGRPVFPFIDQGKDLTYTREREKSGKEEREKPRGREPWGYAALLLCGRVLLVL